MLGFFSSRCPENREPWEITEFPERDAPCTMPSSRSLLALALALVSLGCLCALATAAQEVVFAVVVHRHGDRRYGTPTGHPCEAPAHAPSSRHVFAAPLPCTAPVGW